MVSIIVVGAGIAGLACARQLVTAGLQPILFDKGRVPGGRVATRCAGGFQFDHGAQYVSAKGDVFAIVLRELTASGDAVAWPDETGKSRIVGTPNMSALASALAAGLDLRQGVRVTAIKPKNGGWQVLTREACYDAERVVITMPAPQIADLLGAGDVMGARISGVDMVPCLTLMAGIAAPPPFVTREAADEPIAWLAQDSAKPGRPRGVSVAWVAHAGPAFSAAHLDASPPEIMSLMLPLVCEHLGATADHVVHAVSHRWRYAHVTTAFGQEFVRNDSGSLYLGGDWFIGPRVEAAWTSGTAIANDLLANMPG